MGKTDFIDKHRPRHHAMEAMKKCLDETPRGVVQALKTFGETFKSTADTTKARISNLLDIYKTDIRMLVQDMDANPDHYSEEQKTVITELLAGKEVSDAKKNDVFLAWQRPKELETKTRDLLREMTDRRHREAREDAETVLEDGKTLAEHRDDEASFEKQDHLDKVII